MNYRKFYEDRTGENVHNSWDVHHLDGNRENNDIMNLVSLPREVHSKVTSLEKEKNIILADYLKRRDSFLFAKNINGVIKENKVNNKLSYDNIENSSNNKKLSKSKRKIVKNIYLNDEGSGWKVGSKKDVFMGMKNPQYYYRDLESLIADGLIIEEKLENGLLYKSNL